MKALAALIIAVFFLGVQTLSAQRGAEKTVASTNGFCPDRGSCTEWAHYLRLGDETWGPIYWVTADDGTACEVSGMVQTKLSQGFHLRWLCEWRIRRP